MTHTTNTPRLLARCVAALILATGLGACAPLPASSRTSSATMTPISQDRTPHCIGRHLIDLPTDFEPTSGGYGNVEFTFGLDKNFKTAFASIKPQSFTPESFQKAVQGRVDELKATINTELKAPMLLHLEQVGTNTVLMRRHDNDNYDSSIRSELHQLVGQRYVVVEQKSYVPEEWMDVRPRPVNRYLKIDPQPAEQRLKTISAGLKPHSDPLSAPPVFCRQGVLFDFPHDAVSSTFYFISRQRRDIWFELDYRVFIASRPDETLFDRIDKANARFAEPFGRAGSTQLRRGIVSMGGRQAQEILSKLQRPYHQQYFSAEVRAEDIHDPNQPLIQLNMRTGQSFYIEDLAPRLNEGNSSLTDAQAIALWDSVRASIRLRKLAYTGTLYCDFDKPCPKNGTWALALRPNVSQAVIDRFPDAQKQPYWRYDAGQLMPAPRSIPTEDLKWWEWALVMSS